MMPLVFRRPERGLLIQAFQEAASLPCYVSEQALLAQAVSAFDKWQVHGRPTLSRADFSLFNGQPTANAGLPWHPSGLYH